MIGATFKVIGFFFACFLFLCIPVKGKPIFDHLFRASKPVGRVIADGAEAGLDKSRDLGQRLFSNSVPKENSDEIRYRSASHKRTKVKNNFQSMKDEVETIKYDDHSTEDQEALEKTINEY
jgi:hypothetical protein